LRQAIAEVRRATLPNDLERRRVWQRLRAREDAATREPAPRRAAFAIAALAIFLVGGVAGAVGLHYVTAETQRLREATLDPADRPRARAPRTSTRVPVVPNTFVTPSVPEQAAPATIFEAAEVGAPASSRPPPARPSTVAVRRRPRPLAIAETPPPQAAPSPVPAVIELAPPDPTTSAEVEAASLATALRALRHQGDARTALALLDEHARRFPRGALAAEVALARLQTLLALGRDDEALSALDAQPRPLAPELGVLRGELRAGRGRCIEAIADFEAVMTAAGARGPSRERALYGEAVCQARLGAVEAAGRRYAEYLQRFPSGRFAAEARRALAR
jgi:TolA-binding protein